MWAGLMRIQEGQGAVINGLHYSTGESHISYYNDIHRSLPPLPHHVPKAYGTIVDSGNTHSTTIDSRVFNYLWSTDKGVWTASLQSHWCEVAISLIAQLPGSSWACIASLPGSSTAF